MKRFFKRKQTNNKGFSLVELIISFALLGVVAIGVFMVMSAGSNMFTSVDRQINVQYKSQTAMAQFQQYFMGCSKGITVYDYEGNHAIYFADNTGFYAFFYDTTAENPEHKEEDKVWFKEVDYADAVADTDSLSGYSGYSLFCSDVSDFNIEVFSTVDNGVRIAQSVRITLTVFDDNGKEFETSQLFSFRAKPVYIDAPVDEDSTIVDTLVSTLTGALESGD